MPVIRQTELHRRRVRRANLAKLRKRYQAARTEEEKAQVLEKAARVAPGLTLEEFLGPLGVSTRAARRP